MGALTVVADSNWGSPGSRTPALDESELSQLRGQLAAGRRRLFSFRRGPQLVPGQLALARDYLSGRCDRTDATTSRIAWLAAAAWVLSR